MTHWANDEVLEESLLCDSFTGSLADNPPGPNTNISMILNIYEKPCISISQDPHVLAGSDVNTGLICKKTGEDIILAWENCESISDAKRIINVVMWYNL